MNQKNAELTQAEINEMFGGEARPVKTNRDEIEVSLALRHVRDCVIEAAKDDGVGTNQLAARLGVSPSSVSRMLNGEGDVHVSTIVLYGLALGRCWNMHLVPHGCTVVEHLRVAPEAHVLTADTESGSISVGRTFRHDYRPHTVTAVRIAA